MKRLEILATLWPQMAHYEHFAKDPRLDGIRLNTAMTDKDELPGLMKRGVELAGGKPLYFDVKGRQLRITEILPNQDRLECRLNHPISVRTPTPVLFKAGADGALLDHIEEDGYKLVFDGGPRYNLVKGESLHVRDPSLKVHGPVFTDEQLAYLKIAKDAGIDRYMLSYTGGQDEVDEMRKHVGDDEITCKIEHKAGLRYVQNEYTPAPNLHLLTARGDLFVEVNRPHEILDATQRIIRADPDAIVGSRILLSVSEENVPSCSDINELAWLVDQGYHRFMFCDGLCLKQEPLDTAINVLRAVYDTYAPKSHAPASIYTPSAAYAAPAAKPAPPKNSFLSSIPFLMPRRNKAST